MDACSRGGRSGWPLQARATDLALAAGRRGAVKAEVSPRPDDQRHVLGQPGRGQHRAGVGTVGEHDQATIRPRLGDHPHELGRQRDLRLARAGTPEPKQHRQADGSLQERQLDDYAGRHPTVPPGRIDFGPPDWEQPS